MFLTNTSNLSRLYFQLIGFGATVYMAGGCYIQDRLIDAFLIVLLLAMLVANGTQLFGCRCQTFCPPLWSRLKYLDNYWMDNHGLLYRYLWCPEDEYYMLVIREVPIRFFFHPDPSPLLFYICWYQALIRYLALTNIFLDNTAALRKKHLHPSCSLIGFCILLKQNIYFNMALSYSACYCDTGLPPYHPLLFSYSLHCHVKWRGCVACLFHMRAVSPWLPVLHAVLYETHKTCVHTGTL